ncbi:ISKra4 family transposase [Desulfobacter hydrogenophilus]|uniref:ISKra4 family transposase n=1 Tax=Desulfobacter hydrogenophilus TaxID=2291 RepID=A0A328FA42_9BACT|nr:ISKra4 family transposase [Desulfobacter hydrogenophilus]NDY73080.1 ISKra4 family transposase [Desulfobacter hydrogenophilus]QBH13570.1 ISKra4 family transposase [Desulfobacter hydrogenophilus]RAM01086.1 ISKra4 family transposase [Desulfobacter hydrogenophilus]
MKIKVQIMIEYEEKSQPIVEEIECLCRGDLLPETLGLTLNEGKELLARIQKAMVTHQATEYVAQQRSCPHCGKKRHNKGRHELILRSLFGKLHIGSPRLYTCGCQPQEKQSFSPLADRLPERTTPEFRYLQSKWASLMSYGLTVDMLEEVLPLHANTTTVVRHIHDVAGKLEAELGDEQGMFIEGCERDWEALPDPDEPLIVGIDGGYVHAREGEKRKAGWFEVIVGKSMPEKEENKRFASVHSYDQKPKRRVFEMLKNKGLQMNQDIIFLSDGGDTVRNLQMYISPQAEHLLDWFHITMRITAMKQMAKGLSEEKWLPDVQAELESIKWYLWHGNVFRALQKVEGLDFDLSCYEEDSPVVLKVGKALSEFHHYISSNQNFIPNYGERHRYREIISTAFVESTVNEVISKRMVKRQQMRWTKQGAHLLLQVRVQTLNGDLRDTFCQWYPGMTREAENLLKAA